MRSLQTQDVFAFVRLIDEVGIKDELKELILSKDSIKDLTQESMSFSLIFLKPTKRQSVRWTLRSF